MGIVKGKKGTTSASLPPPPPPLQSESGSVKAIGQGVSQTNLDFRPSKVDFEIIEELPGSPSCNPAVKPVVKIKQFPLKKKWAIEFEWKNLTGVNYINWQAYE